MKIAFDVDGTLVKGDVPRYEVINLLISLRKLTGSEIYVWSGGGVSYAEMWVRKLGLSSYVEGVIAKGSEEVDIAVDDMDAYLGKVTLRV